MATGASSLIANRQLWTVADTITRTLHAPIEFFLIINEKVWQSLPGGPPGHPHGGRPRRRAPEPPERDGIEAGLYALFREKGMTVHELTPDQVADWRACSASVMEGYVFDERRAGSPGGSLMAAYGKLHTDPCCRRRPANGRETAADV